MDNPYECAICFKQFTDPIVLNCGHTFDRKCVESCNVCPICRAEITHRIINWQLLKIIQEPDLYAEQSSAEEDLYIPIEDWQTLYSGVLIRYKLLRNNHLRSGWFVSADLENKLIEIYHKHQLHEIPMMCIEEAWYYPDFVRNTDLMTHPMCCTLM